AATEFYRDHFHEMNEGSRVAWPARYEPGELSALQHIFNLRADIGEDMFQAEYMNSPVDRAKEADALDPVAIASRCSGFDRYISPPECEVATAFIDCGQLLWYMVCGWAEDYS